MALSKIIGLDIGSYSVKMVEIDRSKKGYELNFIGMAPLPDGSVVDKSIKKADMVGNAIRALHSHSSRVKQVSTSLSGKAVIIKQVTMTSMNDSQLEKQIQMEAEPYIPFDIKDVNLDFFIMGDRPEKEGSMEVVLVAAKKDYMAEYLDLLKSLNLSPVVVDVDPFALEVMYEFCYPNVQEEIVALVNVGASTININILKSGASQYTRDLALGGDSITREIMRFFDVDFERAENIKRGSDLDKINARNLRKIFQRSVDYIVSELQKILDFFSTNISYDPIQKIFLSGGAARTYGLASTMEAELNIPVEIVDPFRSLKISEKVFDMDYLNNIGATMALAVGLALRDERDKQV
ncbi:type IV pilus assembly protein PilM [Desulfomonile tiedjei]|uniref:Type IV pilus assembly protein PilM n=1 Tax=Desulfomonile tiedjei (strain ATCC 49306 / DSM 6799 / DCB-1) TaxID=706587 RepID=I4CE91_DESTA|nr:type IV pilus assembly protein PilM [Desulfomonile tiedjei]AFM27882.1 type IV pilus assembly protein PilM [Desulfomonile tiedjei DSM 6799]